MECDISSHYSGYRWRWAISKWLWYAMDYEFVFPPNFFGKVMTQKSKFLVLHFVAAAAAGLDAGSHRASPPPLDVVKLAHRYLCSYIYPNAWPEGSPWLRARKKNAFPSRKNKDTQQQSPSFPACMAALPCLPSSCLFALRQYSKTDFHMSFKFICERADCG